MEQSQQFQKMTQTPVGKLITTLSVPTIISMLVTSLYNMADTFFVSKLGTSASGAVGIVFSVMAIIQAVGFTFGMGSGSWISRLLGAREEEKSKEVAATGFYSAIFLGIVMTVLGEWKMDELMRILGASETILPYAREYASFILLAAPIMASSFVLNNILRSEGHAKFSMIGITTGGILNIALDPLFIFGFQWGMKGAAWATVIGQAVSGIMVIVYFVKLRKMELSFEMLRPCVRHARAIVSLGIASCINQVAMAAVQITMNNTLRYYGGQSVYGADIPLACVGIISKVNMVFMAICIGISQGCQPIWGYNYGAKRYDRVRLTYKLAFVISVIVGVVFFLCFQIFPHAITALFGDGTQEYFRFAERYFRIFMFMTFINGIQPMSSGFFTSIRKAVLGAVISLTRQVFFFLPLIVVLPRFMGIDGVMYAGPVADGAAAVVAIALAVKELKKMGNPKI